jgi:hypothetical protein
MLVAQVIVDYHRVWQTKKDGFKLTNCLDRYLIRRFAESACKQYGEPEPGHAPDSQRKEVSRQALDVDQVYQFAFLSDHFNERSTMGADVSSIEPDTLLGNWGDPP